MIKMGIFLLMLHILICIHALGCGVQGMTTIPPEVVGARLLNGSRASEGRVEVYDGQWGTVCDNLWTINEAKVLCKQLGYPGADEVVIAGRFGEGDGDVFLDMVQCTGDEASLFECSHSDIRNTTCTHKEDVGVVCTTTGSLRLENGTSYRNGRLEFLDDIQGWGTVCNESWHWYYDANVACKQLGLGGSSSDDFSTFSPGTGPIVLGGLDCYSYEQRLDECRRDEEWTPESCTHAQDVGVECVSSLSMELIDTDVDVYHGVPIVYYGRSSGSFCPHNWNINAARVFCTAYATGYIDVLYVDFIQADLVSPRTTILNTINCTGDEAYFTDCPHVEWAYQGNCSLDVYPTVRCQMTEKHIEIVPQSEDYPEYGRVEVTVDYLRASICNRTWTLEAADVICRDGGFKRGARRSFTIGGGSGDRVFDNIRCTGNEERFAECQSEFVKTSSECDHSHDVGVECFANDNTVINLLSGNGTSEGVVEYRVDDRRALMCDATWTNTEVAVACRMLGYEGGTATTVVDLAPEDLTDVFQWDIVCNGDEMRLDNCTINKMDNPTTCAPENIPQVRCGPDTVLGTMRMVGSDEAEQGRLEYFNGEEWVSVWVDKRIENTDINIWDGFCETMGYERELYHYNNDDGQMPFEQGSEGARRICNYNEQCEDLPIGSTTNYQPLGIVCKPFEMVANHPIRLVDRETGETNNETGVVEIYNHGEWGNICETGDYAPYDSDRVCSELGYENPMNTENLRDGEITSKKWFSLVYGDLYNQCSRLYGCSHKAWGHIVDECIPLAVSCVPDPGENGSASSLEGLALSLIVMVVIVTVDLVFADV